MYKHPIPKQITTFEFKLIGFLTLKQFLYLVIFIPLGYIFFVLIPIPYLNIIFAFLAAGIGFALAFLKIQDRPLEVWIRNFIKSINSPTLYIFKKQPLQLDFLEGIEIVDPHQQEIYSKSTYYITQYYQSKNSTQTVSSHIKKKERISFLFFKKKDEPQNKDNNGVDQNESEGKTKNVSHNPFVVKKPFLTGVVYSSKKVPLPGILVYIKDQNGNVLRLMKSNVHGVFATFKPLQAGEYIVEAVDPSSINSFDTMNLRVEENVTLPTLEIYANQ